MNINSVIGLFHEILLTTLPLHLFLVICHFPFSQKWLYIGEFGTFGRHLNAKSSPDLNDLPLYLHGAKKKFKNHKIDYVIFVSETMS